MMSGGTMSVNHVPMHSDNCLLSPIYQVTVASMLYVVQVTPVYKLTSTIGNQLCILLVDLLIIIISKQD